MNPDCNDRRKTVQMFEGKLAIDSDVLPPGQQVALRAILFRYENSP